MTVINSNIGAMKAQASLTANQRQLDTAMTRLSTGLRINSAKDDAAGLAIANRMESQIRGVSQAIRNANDGISLAQTAEGALGEVTNILQRMRELAVQSANATNTSSDRASLDLEVQQLKTELDRIGTSTSFNNQKLLDGTFKNKNLQIGASAGQSISLSIGSVKTSDLGMGQASFGGNVVVSGRAGFPNSATAGTFIDAGDVMINGQALMEIDATDDIGRVVEKINLSIDNVKASAFNLVQADTKGNGVAADGEITITVTPIGASTAVAFALGASSSMDELVDNINAAAGTLVRASLSDDGKLVLSNDTGATIGIDDTTTNAAATGFLVDSGSAEFRGFIKLESTDGSSITIERGNLGLAETGSLDDLEALGFREMVRATTTDAYTLVGKALTSAGINAAWDKTTLKINNVEIYDENIDTDSFEGKLATINALSEKTGVIASATYEKVINTDGMTFVVGDVVRINGFDIEVDDGASASAQTFVDNINDSTLQTGLRAEVNGLNIIIRGENVKQVTYETKGYEMESFFDPVPALGGSAGTQRTLTMDSDDLKAGREFTVVFGYATYGASGGTSPYEATFTIADEATATAKLEALRSDMIAWFVENSGFTAQLDASGTTTQITTFSTSGLNPFDLVKVSGSAIVFTATANMGLLDMQFKAYGASDMDSYIDVSAANGAAATSYGSIKLDSLNNTPISVNVGQSSSAGLHGLFELNVGAADYDVNAPSLGASGGSTIAGLNVSSESSAINSLATIDNALSRVSNIRSGLGAVMNRLESTVNNLSSTVLNTSEAKSRIFDADYSAETTRLTKAQVIQQASTAMLAQANQAPQQVLSLLK